MSTFHRKYLDNILEVWHIPSPYHYKSSSIIIPIVVNPLLYILCLLLIICHLYHYELDKGVDIGYCHNHHGAGLPFPFMGWLFEKYCNCKQCTCYLSCFMRHWQPTLSKLGLFQLYRYIQANGVVSVNRCIVTLWPVCQSDLGGKFASAKTFGEKSLAYRDIISDSSNTSIYTSIHTQVL